MFGAFIFAFIDKFIQLIDSKNITDTFDDK